MHHALDPPRLRPGRLQPRCDCVDECVCVCVRARVWRVNVCARMQARVRVYACACSKRTAVSPGPARSSGRDRAPVRLAPGPGSPSRAGRPGQPWWRAGEDAVGQTSSTPLDEQPEHIAVARIFFPEGVTGEQLHRQGLQASGCIARGCRRAVAGHGDRRCTLCASDCGSLSATGGPVGD